ncbi:LacI family DNA-binding transcriptional regulator [Paenibacillus barengoltzii]|uniref:LacI family DNA-binding transcriptional regulator n=1 Tax=Paenibacillus barengoltzii TaxID=343517 RepID=UPI002DC043CF|nr:LacI family DNA-binding transcriptional regulator [Paenibacillus barengoltzii]MEC2342795.1 LacI family DNA-binding transcriptional regulator [Paenibacillus barengoltzii]
MPRIEDVAERAGVSVTTVSRVLNNRGYISEKTRNKVHQAMKELNYQPNEMARALFRRKSNMIGLIIPAVSHPFFSELTYYLEYYADQYGYKLLLCNSNRNIAKERKYIEMLKKNQVDAIIMGSSVLDIEHYLNLKLPIVSFDRTVAEDIPIVTSDNYLGGKLAAKLFIDKGCQYPVYIYRGIDGPLHEALLANARAQGYEEELASVGLKPIQLQLEITDDDQPRNPCEIVRFLSENPQVDGIFASSDVIAAEVIQACRQLNKTIPRDIKIIGYDDVKVATLVSPQLTTIRQPIREMGERTIELVVKQLDGEEVPKVNSFPVELIERETT